MGRRSEEAALKVARLFRNKMSKIRRKVYWSLRPGWKTRGYAKNIKKACTINIFKRYG